MISLLFSSHASCPSTKLHSAENALTTCSGDFLPSFVRRACFPSIATTPVTFSTILRIHSTNAVCTCCVSTALEQSAKRYSASGAGKPTLTIRRSNQVKSLKNRGNQLILDANTPFTQDGFQLCPHLLNGIQIRAIWRQI